MREALREAEEAGRRGDRPIGAVIVHNGLVIARGSSRAVTMRSNVHHAENMAIISCAPYLYEYSKECTIYTTVEPCLMCLGTIILANIRRVVFGITDKYMKMETYINCNDYPQKRLHLYQSGVLEEECREVFRKYSDERERRIVLGEVNVEELF